MESVVAVRCMSRFAVMMLQDDLGSGVRPKSFVSVCNSLAADLPRCNGHTAHALRQTFFVVIR